MTTQVAREWVSDPEQWVLVQGARALHALGLASPQGALPVGLDICFAALRPKVPHLQIQRNFLCEAL